MPPRWIQVGVNWQYRRSQMSLLAVLLPTPLEPQDRPLLRSRATYPNTALS